MRRFLCIFLPALSACVLSAEVRMLDGRLVRVSGDGAGEDMSRRVPDVPLRNWNVQEWEVSAPRESAAAPEGDALESVPGESLSEKLARISRQKLMELEQKPDPVPPPQPGPLPARQAAADTPPPPARAAESAVAETVRDEEIREIEGEYAALFKKIRGESEAEPPRSGQAPAAQDAPASKAAASADILPAPESFEPLPPVPAPAAEISPEERKRRAEELNARLEADMEEAGRMKPEVPEIPLPQYYTYDGACFSVISSDYDARELGVSVAKVVEETFASYFGRNAPFSGRVAIQMLLPEEARFEGHFQVIAGRNVTLSVKCDPSLPLEEFCSLACDAYLAALTGGKPAPYWVNAGLRAALAQNFAMGLSYGLARFAAENPPDPLDAVVAYEKSPGREEFMESSAYWNLAAIRALSGGQSAFEAIMRALVAGAGDKALLPIRARLGDGFDLEMRAVMLGEICARLGGVKGFEDSDGEAVYYFSIAKQREGEAPEAIFDSEIFERRDEIRNEIKLRVMEIKLALPWANPVYYNAFVALGKMFEAADEGDSDAFGRARDDFAAELQKSRAVAGRAKALLAE